MYSITLYTHISIFYTGIREGDYSGQKESSGRQVIRHSPTITIHEYIHYNVNRNNAQTPSVSIERFTTAIPRSQVWSVQWNTTECRCVGGTGSQGYLAFDIMTEGRNIDIYINGKQEEGRQTDR